MGSLSFTFLSNRRHILVYKPHMIVMRKGIAHMKITNTYLETNEAKRFDKQAELHRRCILLLQAAKGKENAIA